MSEGPAIAVIVSGLSRLYGDDLAGLVETARVADSCGIDQLVLTDHLAIGPRTDRYPYGRFPFRDDEPWPEPLVTLAAMAGATQRVRLGTGILIAPLRSALLLAKSAATLDVLSRGRLELGVGAGWQPEEFEGAGVPFEERWRRLDDTLRACRVLWSEAPARFESPTVSFRDLHCWPRPLQPGGIPILFGVKLTPRNLARIVELGHGWLPIAPSVEEVRDGRRRLREAFAAAGRDPEEARVRAAAPVRVGSSGSPDLDSTLAAVPPLVEAGASQISFALAAFARRRDEIAPFLERLARARLT